MSQLEKCRKCQLEKPLCEFQVARRGASVVLPDCLSCRREYQKARQQEFRERNRPDGYVPPPRVRGDLVQSVEGRQCASCEVFKVWADFYTDKTARSGYDAQCKECRNKERYRRWHENVNGAQDRERARQVAKHVEIAAKGRDYATRKMGLTPEFRQALEEFQGGVCFLCGRVETAKSNGVLRRLSVDHDHACCLVAPFCGECVRGLLCSNCNQKLDWIDSNPGLYERLGIYLSSPPAKQLREASIRKEEACTSACTSDLEPSS